MPEVTYVGLAALEARAIEALTSGVAKAAHDLEGRAKGATPVATGTLQGSIEADDPVVGGFTVSAKVHTGGEASEYAIFVHEGTSAHTIRPRNKKSLAFNGVVLPPGMAVEHPGTPAFKYLERPLIEMSPVYLAYLQRAAAAAF